MHGGVPTRQRQEAKGDFAPSTGRNARLCGPVSPLPRTRAGSPRCRWRSCSSAVQYMIDCADSAPWCCSRPQCSSLVRSLAFVLSWVGILMAATGGELLPNFLKGFFALHHGRRLLAPSRGRSRAPEAREAEHTHEAICAPTTITTKSARPHTWSHEHASAKVPRLQTEPLRLGARPPKHQYERADGEASGHEAGHCACIQGCHPDGEL